MFVDLEAALVAEIKGQSGWKTVAGYQGELDRDNLAALLPAFPACYVVVGPADLGRADNELLEAPSVEITTMVATSSVRSKADSRSAALTLVEQLLRALPGKTLGLEILPLSPTGLDLVMIDKTILVYGVRWTTAFDFVATA